MARTLPVQLEIEVKDEALKRYLKVSARQNKDLHTPLKRAGIVMMRSFAQNFSSEGRPQRWQPLAPNTVAGRRRGSSRILQDTGMYRMSFIARTSPGNIYDLKADSLKMGSNLKIAPYHEFGTKPYTIVPRKAKRLRFMTTAGVVFARKVHHPGLPARPVAIIQKEDEKAILAIFAQHAVSDG